MDQKKPSSMQEALTAFREYLTVEKRRRPRTVDAYLPVVEDLVEFLPQSGEDDAGSLASVRRADLSRFLQEQARSSKVSSAALWNVRLAALRAFFDFLFKQEVIDVNPANRIDRQKVTPPERIPLDLDEMIALVGAAESKSPSELRTRNVAIVQVFMHCGLRVHEVAGLQLAHVDLKGRRLVDVPTKGGKTLTCPMNDVVAEALENYLRADRVRLVFPNEVEHLFLRRDGHPLSIRALQDLVSEYARKAGIKRRVTPHLLRHSAATELVEDLGFDIRAAQRFLGHESVKTTEIYVHPGRRQPQKAVDALGVAWKDRVEAAAAV